MMINAASSRNVHYYVLEGFFVKIVVLRLEAVSLH